MDDMGTYSSDEFPLVESALAMMSKQKIMIKTGLNCLTEVVEKVGQLPDNNDFKLVCYQWVADMMSTTKKIETVVVDLGAELYSPLDEEEINRQMECNISYLLGYGQKIMNPGFDASALLGEYSSLSDQYFKDIETIQKLMQF